VYESEIHNTKSIRGMCEREKRYLYKRRVIKKGAMLDIEN
jgi:hypothetical protein